MNIKNDDLGILPKARGILGDAQLSVGVDRWCSEARVVDMGRLIDRPVDVGGQWPLTGRTDEIHRMQRLASGSTRVLVLAGEAGVGKTRLAQHFSLQLEKEGAAVVRVMATRAAAVLPLGPFAHLLPPHHHGESPGVDDRADLLCRCIDALIEYADGRPLVLLADDAHLLDNASAALLQQLAASRAAFILATVRTGEPAPNAIEVLWKEDGVERCDISGLAPTGVAELLGAVLGGPIDRAAVDCLEETCQGNILFLRELVLGAIDDGALRKDCGIWRLVGPLSPSIRLVELVEARLADLSAEERGLLEVVAFGEPLGSAEFAEIGSAGLGEHLERLGLLLSRTEGGRPTIRLAHSVYGEVLRERTPQVRAREILGQLAEIVEAKGAGGPEDILRIATWQLEGGHARPGMMLEAALIARWRYDFPLAERLALRAHQLGAGFDAALLAARLAGLNGRVDWAETQLATLAARATNDHELSQVTITRIDNQVFHMGRLDEGLRMAAEAEEAIDNPVWRGEIAARRAGILSGIVGPRAASDVAVPILHHGEGRAVVWAAITATPTLARQGRIRDALRSADIGYKAHTELAEPLDWYPWTHDFLRCEALAQAGHINEVHATAADYYEQALIERSPEGQAWFARLLARTVGDRGYAHSAAIHARTSVALFRQLGRPQFEHFVLITLALALALDGNAEGAAGTLTTLDSLGLPPARYFAVDLLQARAWTEVASGNIPAGCRTLEEAVALGAEIGDRTGEAASLHGLARLGQAQHAASRLIRVSEQIEGVLAPARATHAVALAESDGSGLDAVSLAFEQMGAILLAAEAAADGAAVWTQQGDQHRSASAVQRSCLLAAQAENPATPALLTGPTRSVLTRSELRTALLASGGRSNREIAAEFAVSVRTVENQLQRVYQKLGISSRKNLASALRTTD